MFVMKGIQKVLLLIHFHRNFNRYSKHNSTVGLSKFSATKLYFSIFAYDAKLNLSCSWRFIKGALKIMPPLCYHSTTDTRSIITLLERENFLLQKYTFLLLAQHFSQQWTKLINKIKILVFKDIVFLKISEIS